jgi:hypothetical protein
LPRNHHEAALSRGGDAARTAEGTRAEIGLEVARLGLEAGTEAAVDQEGFVGAAGVSLLESRYIDRSCRNVELRPGSGIRGDRGSGVSGRIRSGSRYSIGWIRGVGGLTAAPLRTCYTRTRRIDTTAAEAASTACSSKSGASAAKTSSTADSTATPSETGGERPDLQSEIDLGGACGNLHFAALRREPEHCDVDGPGAGC